MASSNDIRADLPRLLRPQRASGGGKLAAGAAQRPDADVRQLAAWCSSRTSSPARRSAPYVRATTAQKCVRAGGKHNDLDNVGYTARHHTFFEMLGNFSFGDYFKEQAIPYAWELVTKDFGLPKDRLLVTVYLRGRRGGRRSGRRSPACRTSRIIRIPTSDNFWRMGDTGPCGPCSEIFYDHGAIDPRRPARLAGRGRRPVHRDLEPGVHAVRGGPARHARRRCRGPRSTPAWGWSASPPSCRASTTTTTPTRCAR